VASVEQLILEIIARDKNASAAFDSLRRSVDGSTTSLDKNSSSLQKNQQAQTSAIGAAIGVGTAFSAMTSPIASAGAGIIAYGTIAAPTILKVKTALTGPGGLTAAWGTLDNRQRNMALGIQDLSTRYHDLATAMEPRVAQTFGTALGIVNKSLGPFGQLAGNAGTALEGFLVQFDQQSGLSQFITFMSKEAGPAISLLGTDITNITHSVFALLQSWGGIGLAELKTVTVVISGITGSLTWLATHAPGITSAAIAIGGVALALSKMGLLSGALKITGIAAISEQMVGFTAATKGATLAEKGLLATTTALDAINPLVWVGAAAIGVGILVDKIVTFKGSVADLTDRLAQQDHATGLNVAGYQKLADALGGVTKNQAEFFQVMDKGRGAQGGQVDVTDALTAAQQKAADMAVALRGDFSSLGTQYGINTDEVKTLIVKSGALNDILAHNGRITPEAAQKIADYAASENKATQQTNLMAIAVTALTDAMNKNVIAVLTLQGDNIAWQMAMHAANKQLNSNSAGLKGNSDAALANKQAVTAATTAAVSFADDQLKLHGNLKAASAEIEAQIGWLQKHGDKTKFARDQIHALRAEEALIKAQIGTNIVVHGRGTYDIVQAGPVPGHGPVLHPAKGIRVPGYGGGDRWPALLEGGEAVVPKHLVADIAPYLKAHGVPGFAAGGVAGHYSDGVPGLTGFLRTENAATMKAIENATAAAVFQAIRAAQAPAGMGGGQSLGGGVSRWAPVILAALGMLGQSSSWLGAVESRMGRESGGNPAIVNTWDSNWLAGTPSVGLMQVIGPTFAAYAGQFANTGPFEYGVSINPLANTYAGLNYALHRYGSLSVMTAPGGYDDGGWLMPGRLGINTTSRPERVLSGKQEDALLNAINGLRGDIAVLTGVTAQVGDDAGRAIGGALGGAARTAAGRREWSPR
jgi:hypothetical protein